MSAPLFSLAFALGEDPETPGSLVHEDRIEVRESQNLDYTVNPIVCKRMSDKMECFDNLRTNQPMITI